MEIGISMFSKVPYEKQIECLKNAGINRTFLMSEEPRFEETIKALNDNGIICENLHSPFDKINDMWKEGEAGEEMLSRLIDCVDKCEKYSIPVMVLHVSSGRPMTPITEIGDERYKKLMDYATKKGVKVAFENLRYLENLQHNLERYPEACFCWDCGHEFCYTPGVRYIPLFGKRLGALHIHDNACGVDTDNHVLPFDGNIDFEQVAKDLAESGYEGTLMLEIAKEVEYNGEKIYDELTVEEYYEKAVSVARKLADMVENYRNHR